MTDMKLLVSLVFIWLVSALVYAYTLRLSKKGARTKSSKPALGAALIVGIFLLGLLVFQLYKDATAPDAQCSAIHMTTTRPPVHLTTATDYFDKGNYDYEIGNCIEAVSDYTTSVLLDPTYAQAYNNRAYTYMRMRNYPDALVDLDRALTINPNYIQALMNRGDIHNYYYAIDRLSAVADYEKVMALGATKGTSVCGHLFLAVHNGWNIGTFLDLPNVMRNPCR
jgi:tetratricopeptide (TPR) repeat protein